MPSDLNFNYFTTHDFHANEDIVKCLNNNSLKEIYMKYNMASFDFIPAVQYMMYFIYIFHS